MNRQNTGNRAQRERAQLFDTSKHQGQRIDFACMNRQKKRQPAFRYLSAQVLDGFWVGLGPHVGPKIHEKNNQKTYQKHDAKKCS